MSKSPYWWVENDHLNALFLKNSLFAKSTITVSYIWQSLLISYFLLLAEYQHDMFFTGLIFFIIQ